MCEGVTERLGFTCFEEITSGLYPFENEIICNWNKIVVDNGAVIYYKEQGVDESGFVAYVYDPSSDETLFTVKATFFDGIRHLYMGDPRDINWDEYEQQLNGSYGYIYYANPLVIANIFQELAKLVEKYCNK